MILLRFIYYEIDDIILTKDTFIIKGQISPRILPLSRGETPRPRPADWDLSCNSTITPHFSTKNTTKMQQNAELSPGSLDFLLKIQEFWNEIRSSRTPCATATALLSKNTKWRLFTKNDGYSTENERPFTKSDGYFTEDYGFCTKNDGNVTENDGFHSKTWWVFFSSQVKISTMMSEFSKVAEAQPEYVVTRGWISH